MNVNKSALMYHKIDDIELSVIISSAHNHATARENVRKKKVIPERKNKNYKMKIV